MVDREASPKAPDKAECQEMGQLDPNLNGWRVVTADRWAGRGALGGRLFPFSLHTGCLTRAVLRHGVLPHLRP